MAQQLFPRNPGLDPTPNSSSEPSITLALELALLVSVDIACKSCTGKTPIHREKK